ncbi:glycosyltransferase family 4 protein [Paenibacillus aurantiacus]|uniref:Glycosyltransferase family 4 protein n=1 Tax=Paenibacillus aurantiacus TaxID=1936118 RepID=A0ABV5KKE5_9BACL
MPKVLFCATVDYHFEKFHLPYMQWFREQGWEVHVAASGKLALPYTDRKFDLPIARSPLKLARNWSAYRRLAAIMEEQDYDLIHCHTPVGGMLARLAGRRLRKRGAKILYTAHGFHFCKGAPLLNWLLYYPIERTMAAATDCLITINEEDYELARRRRFPAGRIERVSGVGVNLERYHPLPEAERHLRRRELGLAADDMAMFFAAEFNANKNQQLLIHALAGMRGYPGAKLLLAGDGGRQAVCRELAERLGVADRVLFLGYRHDIDRLLPLCDLAVASSLREGLPVNIMEAMACGLPVVATRNRGHNELVEDAVNGYLVTAGDEQGFARRLEELCRSRSLRRRMGQASAQRAKRYALPEVRAQLADIYSRYMAEDRNEAEDQHHRAYL